MTEKDKDGNLIQPNQIECKGCLKVHKGFEPCYCQIDVCDCT